MNNAEITQRLVAEIQRSIGAAVSKAETAANLANKRAIDAAEYASNAKTYLSNSTKFAQQASSSAAAAAQTAAQLTTQINNLAGSVSGAQDSANQAAAASNTAIGAASSAQAAANAAAASANQSAASLNNIQTYVDNLIISQNAAAASAAAAAASAATAETAVNVVANSEAAAAASASAAAAAADVTTRTFNGTTTTTLTIGMGNITFATQAGKAWVAGQYVSVANSNTAGMVGTIVSYNITTGNMTVAVTSYRGTGSYSSWGIGLSPSSSAAVPGTIGWSICNSARQINTWDGLLADTTANTFTVIAPPNPVGGDKFSIADVKNFFGTNKLTLVSTDGATFAGNASPMDLDISNVRIDFVYDGTTWQMLLGMLPVGGSAVSLDAVQTLSNKTLVGATISANSLTVLAGATFNGVVNSTSGGFMFPDGTTQTTAATSGATGGGTDKLFYNSIAVMTTSYAIPSGNNTLVLSPMKMNPGAALTVPAGTTLKIF